MEFNAKIRTIKGKNVKSLRRKDTIPAVLYGRGIESRLLQVNYLDFEKICEKAGKNTLIDLKTDNQPAVKVLIHEIKKDPLSDRFNHVDFYQIEKDKKVAVEVDLEFAGESKAIKELGGVLVKSLDKIKIECLPSDLIHTIKVDICKLNTFNDFIKVSDICLPEKIKILEKRDEIIASVVPPRVEKIEEKVEEKAEVKAEEKGAAEKNKEEAKTVKKEK